MQATIRKQEYVPFLREVDKAIKEMVRERPTDRDFLAEISKEADKWLNQLPEFKSASFKAGVTYGVWSYVSQTSKSKKPSYIQ
jgi:hypothetical protein